MKFGGQAVFWPKSQSAWTNTPDQICSDHQPLVQSSTAWTSRRG